MVNLKIMKPQRQSRPSLWDLANIPDFEREFSSPLSRWMGQGLESVNEGAFMPRIDIIENDDSWVFKADLPEIKTEDIQVAIAEGVLTIKGERKFEEEIKDGNYTRFERHYGTFERKFSLPSGIDQENVSADYKNGVLTLTIPKKEESKPKTIDIQVK